MPIRKKKYRISSLALAICSSLLVFPNQSIKSEELDSEDFKEIDITPEFETLDLTQLENLKWNDKGKIEYSLKPIEGVQVLGQLALSVEQASVLEIGQAGNYTATNPGETSVYVNVSYTEEDMARLEEAFPEARLVLKDLAYKLKMPVSVHAGMNEVYRIYNPNSGEHFFTADVNEKDVLVDHGWTDENVARTMPDKSSLPVYRLYNPNAGDHHYTFSASERDHLVQVGWRDEGISFYSAAYSSVPVYRLYNPNTKAGAHHFTTAADESRALSKAGWRDEKTAWYGVGS